MRSHITGNLITASFFLTFKNVKNTFVHTCAFRSMINTFFAVVVCLAGEYVAFTIGTTGTVPALVYGSGIVSGMAEKNKPTPKQPKLDQWEKELDSIARIRTRKYEATMDSISKAKQLEILKEANQAQNDKTAYYSLIVGVLAIIVTLLFSMKFNFVRRGKYYRELEERLKESDMKLKTTERSLKSMIKSIDGKIVNLNSRDNTLDKRLVRLSLIAGKNASGFKKTSKNIKTPALYIKCERCNEDFDPMKNLDRSGEFGSGMTYVLTTCTFCNKVYVLEINDWKEML